MIRIKRQRLQTSESVYLDFKKAFDTVKHDILINKLSKYHFSSTVIQWIKFYLENRKLCVRVHNATSAIINTCMGVPQGSTLGPPLFTLYINDLPDACSPATCQMYADDTIIYVHSKTKIQAAKELSSLMTSVQNWLNNMCLHLNLDKTVCMYFTKSQNKEHDPPVMVAEKPLTVVQEYKHLGIVIDSKLTCKSQVKKLFQKINFSLATFRQMRNNLTTEESKTYLSAMIFTHPPLFDQMDTNL